jgi:hypothetical protein
MAYEVGLAIGVQVRVVLAAAKPAGFVALRAEAQRLLIDIGRVELVSPSRLR